MLVGDASTFAIESGITQAYERLSLRALGFFTLLIAGQRYGVKEPDATMLACSFDEVERRRAQYGSHIAPMPFVEAQANEIANAVYDAIYRETPPSKPFFGMSLSDFTHLIYSNHLLWAPDGDEAFDDGSYVIQFDIESQVRLIAFRSKEGYLVDQDTLREVLLPATSFYSMLEAWHDAFELEWQRASKS